jgi:DNA-binding response OmpR family regulator
VDTSVVLIIADADWMSAVLERYLTDAGFEVHQAHEAREGYKSACELKPDCIIVDEELPDIDGFWVVQKVRAEKTRVSSVPILFLTSDLEALQQLNIGADLFLKKPLNNDEVAVQVRSLLNMSNRLREKRRDSSPPGSTADGAAALRGDLAQMSIATVLTVLEMERRTGELTVEQTGGTRARFGLREGSLTSVQLAERPHDAVHATQQVIGWKSGRFWFTPSEAAPGSASGQSIGMVLLEAARLEDEGDR